MNNNPCACKLSQTMEVEQQQLALAGLLTPNIESDLSADSTKKTTGRPLTNDRKRPHPCALCPSRFGSRMELEEHQNSHTGQKPFECDICRSRFNRRSTLWNHKRIHSDAKPFHCAICEMTFKWKNSLKCHQEMHLRKNELPGQDDAEFLGQVTYATAAKRQGFHENAKRRSALEDQPSMHLLQPSSPPPKDIVIVQDDVCLLQKVPPSSAITLSDQREIVAEPPPDPAPHQQLHYEVDTKSPQMTSSSMNSAYMTSSQVNSRLEWPTFMQSPQCHHLSNDCRQLPTSDYQPNYDCIVSTPNLVTVRPPIVPASSSSNDYLIKVVPFDQW